MATNGISKEEYKKLISKKTTSKYKSIKVEYDFQKFDSIAERDYYIDLKLLRREGSIDFFLRQVPFHLPGGIKYTCDFIIFYKNNNDTIFKVVDVKSEYTAKMQSFIRNQKLIRDIYNVEIGVIIK